MAGLLVLLAATSAVLLAAMKWGVRKQPDGTPIARTPVNTRGAAIYAIPGVLIVLLMAIFAQNNAERLGVLATAAILAGFFLGALHIRRER